MNRLLGGAYNSKEGDEGNDVQKKVHKELLLEQIWRAMYVAECARRDGLPRLCSLLLSM